MANEIGEDEVGILEDQYTDDFIEAAESLPQLLALSFIVTWYSFVEQKLIRLCEELHLSISITPKDTKNLGKGIWRARRFLLEGKKYEIDKIHWQELVNINKLRNIVVHEGKYLPTTLFEPESKSVRFTTTDGVTYYILIDENLFQYLSRHNMVRELGILFEILPSFDYCKHLIEFSKQLFSKLYTDLKM